MYHVQTGSQCSSALMSLFSCASSLRGLLLPATSSGLHIRPGAQERSSCTRGCVCVCMRACVCAGTQYLACECIVSLESVERPLDVDAAEHSEVSHEQVSSLHEGLRPHRPQPGVVKQVLTHLHTHTHTHHISQDKYYFLILSFLSNPDSEIH